MGFIAAAFLVLAGVFFLVGIFETRKKRRVLREARERAMCCYLEAQNLLVEYQTTPLGIDIQLDHRSKQLADGAVAAFAKLEIPGPKAGITQVTEFWNKSGRVQEDLATAKRLATWQAGMRKSDAIVERQRVHVVYAEPKP
jgi:hypothetical protein